MLVTIGDERVSRRFGWALMAVVLITGVVVGTAPPSEAQGSPVDLVVASDGDGPFTMVASIGSDGTLSAHGQYNLDAGFETRNFPGGLTDQTRTWVGVDVAVAGNDHVVAAVDGAGQLWTRLGRLVVSQVTGDTYHQWGEWAAQGNADWSTSADPSIDMLAAADTATILLGAVKADGRLYTRVLVGPEADPAAGTWGTWQLHGLATWSRADVIIEAAYAQFTSNVTGRRALWLVGVKQDGRLYTRTDAGQGWESFHRHGLDTWEPGAEPTLATGPSGIIGGVLIGAIKADGRLYTRLYVDPEWMDWIRHGGLGWVAADVAYSGVIWVLGTKSDGRLFFRSLRSSGGLILARPWETMGLPTWSARQAALAQGTVVHIIGVKENGRMPSRYLDHQGWSAWLGAS